MNKRGALAAATLALTSAPLAHASPLIINQQRVDQAPPADALRGLTDDEGVSPALPTPAAPTATPAPGAVIAPLRTVHIVGSSLPAETLATVWLHQVGAPLDDAAITAISNALTAAYQQSDIALYTIVTPAQDLSRGVLDVRVVEGHVANIVLQTDDTHAPDIRLARSYAERLTHETPLRRATLERVMSLIRDIPGERVQANLTAATEAGGVDLTLALRRNRADISVSASNRGTPLLGRTQGSVDVSLNGMIRGGDRTDIAVTAPLEGDAFHYGALAYMTPIGTDGLSVTANISNLRTKPRNLGIEGNATAGGVSISYPLLRGFTRNAFASIGMDALDSENAAVGGVVDTSRIRAVRAGLSYVDGSATTSRSAAAFLSFGIDGLGARVDPLFADADFVKLAMQAGWSHLYATHIALRLNAQAQLSSSALPASEQFALGGDAYGRAFPSAIIQGDSGVAASIEAAYLAPDGWLPSVLAGSEGYVFFDAGDVHANARSFVDSSDSSLSSAGIGARIALDHKFTLGAELARGIDTPGSTDDDWRLVYTLVGRH